MDKKTTNKEMIATVINDIDWLKTQFSNHLSHHWQITVILLGAVITQSVALVIALLL